MSYRGYFREKKESRMFHMRHKGSLMVENDEVVFIGKGDNVIVKYNETKRIELLKARSGIEFETNDGIIYIYASTGDAGVSSHARQTGNTLFGIQGGNVFGQIARDRAAKRINEEIYKMIDYHRKK